MRENASATGARSVDILETGVKSVAIESSQEIDVAAFECSRCY